MATPKKYRVDKTAFKIQTFEEADKHYGPWEDTSTAERLDAAFYLICYLYGIPGKAFYQIGQNCFFKT